ncbi:hypothetical protein DS742_11745 [Lacrimispora amygdalina]|uniref:Uncharacterized protein n=1 Tax=Lacrimispora amygdalina TaxID=253257 RepID=A0A3E2NCN8_9FIRM|nr:hypothetical protein [Clostridium indicum]RFZ78778.1 hypothetical protein DS742_11745 [Clostridium indicum]
MKFFGNADIRGARMCNTPPAHPPISGSSVQTITEKRKTVTQSIPGIAFANDNGSVNVVPIISVGTEKIIFRTKCIMRKSDIEDIEKNLTEKIGIKCVVIDPHTELAAIIDG